MDPETRAHNLSCGERKQQDTHNMTETQEKESWVVCPWADTPRRAMEALDGGDWSTLEDLRRLRSWRKHAEVTA